MKLNVPILTGVILAQTLSTVNGAVLGFQPSATVVPAVGGFQVSLTVSGLGAGTAPSLGVFDLDVAYDPGIVGLASVGFGDPGLGDQLDLSGFGSITSFDGSVPGQLNLFELSLDTVADLDTLQADSFALCVLSFTPLATGVSALTVSVNLIGDSNGDPLAVDVSPGSITVVPEPGAWGVALAIGLLLWVRVSRVKPRSLRT
ncbi:MAG: hypothetical protein H7A45_21480 [Verrucomicrobiales bacterium]|nr:hypothetical protein [Verrucomicrobiales bacterium]